MKTFLNKTRAIFITAIICLLGLSGKVSASEDNLVLLKASKANGQFSIGTNGEWIFTEIQRQQLGNN